MIAYGCIAVLGLLIFAGGFHVSMCRARGNIVQGYPSDPSHFLHKAVRAHGNTVEYAPFAALLIYVISQMHPPLWIIVSMICLTLGRVSIFFGLILSSTLDKPQPLRFLGALSTYIFGTILCGYLLFIAMFKAV